MTDNAVVAIATLVFALVVAVVGFIIARAVNDGRDDIRNVATKVDQLVTQDTTFAVALTELRIRVTSVEAHLLALEQSLRRRRGGEDPL